MTKRVRASIPCQTKYGEMTFYSFYEADEFLKTIRSWKGFGGVSRPKPKTWEEAVEYHLAYVHGGFAEVEKMMQVIKARRAEARAKERAHKKATEEMFARFATRTDATSRYQREEEKHPDYAIRQAERSLRYALAELAPKESAFYKRHFQESYPGYLYGA